jgi:hypothetical protein
MDKDKERDMDKNVGGGDVFCWHPGRSRNIERADQELLGCH